MSPRCFRIHPDDNVATLLDDADRGPVVVINAGTASASVAAREPIKRGHKVALVDVPAGQPVIKFGARIGHATKDIARGDWVHLHNLASDLDERSAGLDLHTGVASDNAAAYG